MATWQLGPFVNDDAVEWCDSLENAAPGQRTDFVRHTLDLAVSPGRTLTEQESARVVAAAATVLQCVAGAPPSGSAYAPRFLLGRTDIHVSRTLCALAKKAIDVVLAEGSTWRQQWADDIEEEEALAILKEIRLNLALTLRKKSVA